MCINKKNFKNMLVAQVTLLYLKVLGRVQTEGIAIYKSNLLLVECKTTETVFATAIALKKVTDI